MTAAIDQGNIVALGERIRVRVAQLVAQIARRFGVFDGRVRLSLQKARRGTDSQRRARSRRREGSTSDS
jgi:hypothetical protein